MGDDNGGGSGGSGGSGGNSSSIGVKFEEETFLDDDWLLTVLSELIFDKLGLQKPEITLH